VTADYPLHCSPPPVEDTSSGSSSPARSGCADGDDDDGQRLQAAVSTDDLNLGLRHRAIDVATATEYAASTFVVMARTAGAYCPVNFCLSEYFFCVGKCFSKNTKFWLMYCILGECRGKIEISSTQNLLCQKSAAVSGKIATSCGSCLPWLVVRFQSAG